MLKTLMVAGWFSNQLPLLLKDLKFKTLVIGGLSILQVAESIILQIIM